MDRCTAGDKHNHMHPNGYSRSCVVQEEHTKHKCACGTSWQDKPKD